MNDFDTIGVPQQFSKRLAARAITRATAVQRLVIPQLLEGKSVVFRSATGTGKTFAYLLPALTFIMNGDNGQTGSPQYRGPRLLVCAPTLELCSQIKTELDFLLAGEEPAGEVAGRQKKPGVALLIGSVSIGRQIENLKKTKPAIAVGNPGRILLLAKSGRLSFRALSFLVLDEADRLTAPECREETAQLAELISRECGKLTVAACSATMSGKTAEYLQPLLEEAVKLETDEHEILRQRIEHWAIFSEGRRKTRTLLSFIAAAKPKKTLVFTSRSYDAGKIVTALQQKKIAAAGLYSGMDKDERKNALGRFRSGSAAVLVSSDLAARGLDIPGISHVVSMDVGENPDVYVHRAGRTGRAGNRGIMICIGDEQEMHRLAALEKKLGITVFPKELYGGRICAPVVPEIETIEAVED